MNLNEITAKVKELSSKSSGKIESKIKFVFKMDAYLLMILKSYNY
ncbi:MAG: hypothetical protein Ct9H90mP3_1380 [Flammeovirgaceae bacterium]|nr:MAG: hypothetical protein Ct9H90mP3_1380 [Flammeovirgaceae bacterium]